jgi:hypothetical protein
MMGAASTSETVNFYQTTQHYKPEDSHLHYSLILGLFNSAVSAVFIV